MKFLNPNNNSIIVESNFVENNCFCYPRIHFNINEGLGSSNIGNIKQAAQLFKLCINITDENENLLYQLVDNTSCDCNNFLFSILDSNKNNVGKFEIKVKFLISSKI